ncbi:MAG: hypothetical protein PHO08_20105 [Methylococcales bacterium]|nr:hypothetical protein [Methylococcales bacterium]
MKLSAYTVQHRGAWSTVSIELTRHRWGVLEVHDALQLLHSMGAPVTVLDVQSGDMYWGVAPLVAVTNSVDAVAVCNFAAILAKAHGKIPCLFQCQNKILNKLTLPIRTLAVFD